MAISVRFRITDTIPRVRFVISIRWTVRRARGLFLHTLPSRGITLSTRKNSYARKNSSTLPKGGRSAESNDRLSDERECEEGGGKKTLKFSLSAYPSRDPRIGIRLITEISGSGKGIHDSSANPS